MTTLKKGKMEEGRMENNKKKTDFRAIKRYIHWCMGRKNGSIKRERVVIPTEASLT